MDRDFTTDTLTPLQLDSIVRNLPNEPVGTLPKTWKRVNCGQIEAYVGDGIFVVALVEKLPESVDELATNQINTEETIIKYLKSEGFLGEEYAYVGMQRFAIRNHPKGFTRNGPE